MVDLVHSKAEPTGLADGLGRAVLATQMSGIIILFF